MPVEKHYSESILEALGAYGWVMPRGFTSIASKHLGREVSASFCERGRYLALVVGGLTVLDMDCRPKGLDDRDFVGAAREFNDKVNLWAASLEAVKMGVRPERQAQSARA